MIKEGYKVVHRFSSGMLFSAVHLHNEYKIGKWTKPNKHCGPLCVFDDITSAFIFFHLLIGNKCIYRCLYESSDDNMVWDRVSSSRFKHKKCSELLSTLPHGTRLAKKVKLLESVHGDS